jgi:hypothetical protein
MRACFLGQMVCALGNGIAVLQSPPLPAEASDTQTQPQAQQKTSISTELPGKPKNQKKGAH